MLAYDGEQKKMFIDVLHTFMMKDKKISKADEETLLYIQNDVFKNATMKYSELDEDEVVSYMKKLNVDIYLVHLFNLIFNIINDPDFDTSVISKKRFIKNIERISNKLDENTQNKITKNKNFNKQKKYFSSMLSISGAIDKFTKLGKTK